MKRLLHTFLALSVLAAPAFAQRPADVRVRNNVGIRGFVHNYDFLMDVAQGNVPGHQLVRKFGMNNDIDATTESIWTGGGLYAFPTAAQTLDVVSADADDTSAGTGARTFKVYGLDGNYNMIEETVTLNGATPVTTTNTFLRVWRGKVITSGSTETNEGDITIDQTTSGAVMAIVLAGKGQTQLGVYTVPAGKTAYVLDVMIGGQRTAGTGLVNVEMFVRNFGESFTLRGTYGQHTYSGDSTRPFLAPEKIPEKSDIRFDAFAQSTNQGVSVEFAILLVDN